jgi:hypothetical protein
MAGFVYIMSNEAYKNGLLKIGMSSSDPTEFRRDELYTTGVPSPFKVEYFAFVDDHERVEKKVHRQLKDKRPNYQREFFACTVPEAIILIRELSVIHYEKVLYQSPDEIEAERKRQEWIEKKNQERIEKLALEKEREEQRKINDEKEKKQQKKDELIGDIKGGISQTLRVFLALVGLLFLGFVSMDLPSPFNWLLILIFGGLIIVWLERNSPF